MHTRIVLFALFACFACSAPLAAASYSGISERIDARLTMAYERMTEAHTRLAERRAHLFDRFAGWNPRDEEPGEDVSDDDSNDDDTNDSGPDGDDTDDREQGDEGGEDEGLQEGDDSNNNDDNDESGDGANDDEQGGDEGAEGGNEGSEDGDSEDENTGSDEGVGEGGGDGAADGGSDEGSEDEADNTGSAAVVQLTEVLYDPSPNLGQGNDNDNEWIEVYNGTDTAVDVAGWAIDDGANNGIDVISDTTLLVPAGEYLLITRKASTDDYWTYGEGTVVVHLDGTLGSGGLRNVGESVILRDAEGVVVDAVSWGDAIDTGYAYVDTTGLTAAGEQGKSIVRSSDSWEISDTPTPGA